MKIFFFIDWLGSGGKERRLVELMTQLKLIPDFDFELVLMKKDIHFKQVLDLGINIHYIIRKTRKDISVFYKFYKLCIHGRPDIVHCWDSMTAVYSIPACKLLKIKLVNGMVIDTPVKQNINNKDWFRAKLTFPFSDFIIGNSRAGLLAYKAPVKKSQCIYNGINLERFEKLKDPILIREELFGKDANKFFIVGMVAMFYPRKDYQTLIKAALKIISTNNRIRFILVGTGDDYDEIKNKVPETISDRIIFLGQRSDVEVIINIFDIGILLTNAKVHGEGISNSIIEYMALGKPVIATKGGGTNEVVIDNHNGYLIDSESPDQLINKINTFIKNRELIIEFGINGKQMIYKKFDVKIMTRQYLSIYSKLTGFSCL